MTNDKRYVFRVISSSGSLKDLFSAAGDSQENDLKYDLASAHYNFSPFSLFPAYDRERLENIEWGEEYTDLPHVEDVIAQMITNETSLRIPAHRIQRVHGSTRKAVDEIFKHSSNSKRRGIAIPLPNWHFWDCEQSYQPYVIGGTNEDELISSFRDAAKSEMVGGLILACPSVPLMMNLSAQGAAEIDNIALQYGIDIIIDDVLRGVQPIGQRDSIARYFTRPYVLEGFTKRFGDELFDDFSYVVAPEGERLYLEGCVGEMCNSYAGYRLHLALQYATQPALDELEKRNKIFDRILSERAPNAPVKIVRPSPTHLTTLLEFEPEFPLTARQFSDSLKQYGVQTAPMQMFVPEAIARKYFLPSVLQKKLRITVGNLDADDLSQAATILADEIQSYSRG
ncbi:hypothetical protein HYV86_00830 [Candidatus Woesearchaeota archaeon]|nr:hypothetical protein [Candidatus Woesearchaeota archaeon]